MRGCAYLVAVILSFQHLQNLPPLKKMFQETFTSTTLTGASVHDGRDGIISGDGDSTYTYTISTCIVHHRVP